MCVRARARVCVSNKRYERYDPFCPLLLFQIVSSTASLRTLMKQLRPAFFIQYNCAKRTNLHAATHARRTQPHPHTNSRTLSPDDIDFVKRVSISSALCSLFSFADPLYDSHDNRSKRHGLDEPVPVNLVNMHEPIG